MIGTYEDLYKEFGGYNDDAQEVVFCNVELAQSFRDLGNNEQQYITHAYTDCTTTYIEFTGGRGSVQIKSTLELQFPFSIEAFTNTIEHFAKNFSYLVEDTCSRGLTYPLAVEQL